VLGFFSFTEVTDPAAHRAYNEWHQFDHLPEQFSLDGMLFGQRWVCTPACRTARVAVGPLLEPCHYMTLYLMRDAAVLEPFAALARRLRQEDRFFSARYAHLSGPFAVAGRWVSPRIALSPAALPFRPSTGIYVVVGTALDGAALVGQDGVAGAWDFVDEASDDEAHGEAARRHITVAFLDGDLPATATTLGQWCLQTGESMEWAGPLEGIDPNRWNWFDRLTAQ
jgi:hypothetical protein